MIVEQLSNYIVLLREQDEIEKHGFVKQNTLSNDEIRCELKLCLSAKEHIPKTQYEKSDGDDRKDDNLWIEPKKSMPIFYFFKKSKKEEGNEKANNKHNILADEHDDNEDEDYEMKCHKINKDATCDDVKMNYYNKKIKANISND